MNNLKRQELQHKRNIELQDKIEILSNKIEDLEFQEKFNNEENRNGYKKAKQLISELESIRDEWLKGINELKEEIAKCKKLNKELKDIKKILLGRRF